MRVAVLLMVVFLLGCTGTGTGTRAPTARDPFMALKAAPLKLPHVVPGQPCPESVLRDLGPHLGASLGDGPVYAMGSLHWLHQQVGHPSKLAWGAAPSYAGPIRIRGGRIDGKGRLLLAAPDTRWRGRPVKTVDRQGLVTELDLLETHSVFPGVPSGWRLWPSATYVETHGCYAWQVDTIGRRELITLQI